MGIRVWCPIQTSAEIWTKSPHVACPQHPLLGGYLQETAFTFNERWQTDNTHTLQAWICSKLQAHVWAYVTFGFKEQLILLAECCLILTGNWKKKSVARVILPVIIRLGERLFLRNIHNSPTTLGCFLTQGLHLLHTSMAVASAQ